VVKFFPQFAILLALRFPVFGSRYSCIPQFSCLFSVVISIPHSAIRNSSPLPYLHFAPRLAASINSFRISYFNRAVLLTLRQ
jgi:hypothetical protein